VYRRPGSDTVRVRRDLEWKVSGADSLSLDLYAPIIPNHGVRFPALIFASGYPDPGFQTVFGCRFKDMGQSVSWAQLVAAFGIAAVTYTNREPADVHALVQYLRERGASLGIDGNRLGVFGCSGNGPTALSVVMSAASPAVRCAVLCYPLTLDTDGTTVVADAAKAFGFVDACARRSVADLPPTLPMFIARAGRDEIPQLNESLDRFLSKAVARNLPITFVNHAEGPHAFDVADDSEASRDVIRLILAFLRRHLGV